MQMEEIKHDFDRAAALQEDLPAHHADQEAGEIGDEHEQQQAGADGAGLSRDE